MPGQNNYSEAAAEKRNSQSVYARNMSALPADRARGCSYGRVRPASNSLVRMVSR